MSEVRNSILSAVYVALVEDNKVFLLRRCKTGYKDGIFNLPSGHIEKSEFPSDAAVRETLEEAGVVILPEDLEYALAQYRIQPKDKTYSDFFFITQKWEGEPHSAEEDKADKTMWCDIDNLPDDMIDYQREMLQDALQGIIFRQFEEK